MYEIAALTLAMTGIGVSRALTLIKRGTIMIVTIKQIAELANVSIGTVDRVLHNRPGVNPEKRRKIQQIANELGYKPNYVAKALAVQKNPITIGIILSDFYKPYANFIMEGIIAAEKELKDFGLKIEILKMTNLVSAKEQVELIDKLISTNVSAIMIRPTDDVIVRDKINEAVAKGIPVVTYNSDIDNSKRLCFVGEDLYKSGKVAAELLGKIMNKEGKVAILAGSFMVKAHNERIHGFKDVINTYFPNIKIVECIETLEDANITYNKVIELFKKHTDIKGIYAAAGCFEQIGQAIKSLEKQGLVSFAGYDYYPEVMELIKDGVMDFSIGQDLFAQGYEPIKILFDYLFKKVKPSKEYYYTNLDIKVRWNVE